MAGFCAHDPSHPTPIPSTLILGVFSSDQIVAAEVDVSREIIFAMGLVPDPKGEDGEGKVGGM